MTNVKSSENAFLNKSPLLGINENTHTSNCSSDTEEIEAEPKLRPTRLNHSTSQISQKPDIVDSSPLLLDSDSDASRQNKAGSEASEYNFELPLINSDEFRERERTAYSYNSSSLSKITKKETTKSTNIHSKNISPEFANPSAGFSCNICFDTACNPVLTLCGHLFCWPCLHRWLSSLHKNPLCPVCKAGCGKDKVIPVYGRGSEEKDPRFGFAMFSYLNVLRLSEPIPDRPKGQRPKPQPVPAYGGWSRLFSGGLDSEGFGGTEASFNFHAGFGFFPTFTFQYTSEAGAQLRQNGSPQQGFLFRLFLMLAILVFIANLLG